MGKEPRVVRMPTLEEQRTIQEAYAGAVGRVAHIWNYLQEDLGRLFVMFLGVSDPRNGWAVWYSTDSDRAQQRMLRDILPSALAAEKWSKRPKVEDDLAWLLTETSSLADKRNSAIHAPTIMMIGGGRDGGTAMASNPLSGHPRAKRLAGMDLMEELEWYEQWGETLVKFARAIQNALIDGEKPWPDRPRRPARTPKKDHREADR